MGEVTLPSNKTVPFQNMNTVNTGFVARMRGLYLESALFGLIRGAMVQNLWNEQTIEI